MRNVKQVCRLIVLGVVLAAGAGADDSLGVDNTLSAEEKIRQGFGVGVIVGEPTGLSAKKWISDTTAIVGAAAWSFSDYNSFQLQADYLWHSFDLIKTEDLPGRFPVYFGVGGRVKFKGENNGKGDERTRVGVRVPVGISYLFHDVPVDLFAEVVPVLDIAPETKFGIGVAIGARYYFR